MRGRIETDYLVVGAGAMGMAFTDALVDHSDATVTLVDRRHGPGGHWLAAYPFVRLHQASSFYGVASARLGEGRVQESGPERGLQERATQPEVVGYYARALDRLRSTGRVEFLPNTDYRDGEVVSTVSGRNREVTESCRLVDARYLAPSIPAERGAPFEVLDQARVVPVNELASLSEAPSQYVVVGSGKTATDACIWLLSRGVDPDAIDWVRPREPWMLNRAKVQPDPVVALELAADTMEAAEQAHSPEGLFLRLEEVGVMLRMDRATLPTMAKAPTLAAWELAELRTIEHVIRRGHLAAVEPGRLHFGDGSVAIRSDALVVHCAASGLQYPALVPIWQPDEITLQTIRAGFPCFGAALAGYVEATRDDDEVKNHLCPPTPLPDSMAGWARMNLLGTRATQSFTAESDIAAWADTVPLNPARVPPDHPGSSALDEARTRLSAHTPGGLAGLEALAAADRR
jgi:NAD(P)-binding Rossmann-like domain